MEFLSKHWALAFVLIVNSLSVMPQDVVEIAVRCQPLLSFFHARSMESGGLGALWLEGWELENNNGETELKAQPAESSLAQKEPKNEISEI